MANINHKDLLDPKLHEPKGVAAAAANTVYVADGAGSGVWQTAAGPKSGVYVYEDTGTSTTPIPLTAAGTLYDLTNDKLGALTNVLYGLSGVADVWDSSTSRFDFSGLSLGDVVYIRFNADVTTASANTAITYSLETGTGAVPVSVTPVDQKNFKTAGTYNETETIMVPIVSDNVRLNPARLRASADATGATVTVNDFIINVITKV